MRKEPMEIIKQRVEEAKAFPNPLIEYSFELPEHPKVKPDKFFGVKAQYNRNISKEVGAIVTYKFGA